MISQLDTMAMMQAEAGATSQSRRSAFADMLAQAREMLDACDRAGAAAHRYEELSRMSDEELASQGLTRSDLPRKAFDEMGG
jgi:hypothetical protein